MKDFIESLFGAIAIAALVYAFCKFTPDQLSGETDHTVDRCEAVGEVYAPAK